MVLIAKARDGLRRVRRASVIIKACALSGLIAGLTLGVIVSSAAGLAVGVTLGVAIGIVGGIVMDREERRHQYRTRQLDSLTMELEPNEPKTPAGPSWVTEWLTPPPPQVG